MTLSMIDARHVEFAGLCGMYGWERDRDAETRRGEDAKTLDRYYLLRDGTRMEITYRNVECWDFEQMVKILKRGYVECDPRFGNATEAKPPMLEKLMPSAELAVIVGKKPLTNSEAVKRVYDYVKANNLLVGSPRMIHCDGTLRAICGGESVISLRQLGQAIKKNLKS